MKGSQTSKLVSTLCPTGKEKCRSDCLGQANFVLGQVKLKFSGLVSKQSQAHAVNGNENVSSINDDFQSETVLKLKTAR